MIDHIVLNVKDLAASRRFYEKSLTPLGYEVILALPEGVGFWIVPCQPAQTQVHVAFACKARQEVDAFHAAALQAGGADNGAPGIREQYHPNYYGGFVLDPDGNNIEAVCHGF